jgi:hypothetical protein
MEDTLDHHVYTVFYVKPNIRNWLNTHRDSNSILFLCPFPPVLLIQCLTIQAVSIKDHHDGSTSLLNLRVIDL